MSAVSIVINRSFSRTGGPRDPRKFLPVALAMMWGAGFVAGIYFSDWVKLVVA